MPAELRQDRILRLNNSAAQRGENLLDANFEKNWKCKPRKKKLLGSPDQMYNMPDAFLSRGKMSENRSDKSETLDQLGQ
jgi:hypothetical protein